MLGTAPGPLVASSAVLEIVVTVIFVASALALIFFVLLHSGKGGGLSDMFGGGLGATAAGSTVVEKNLDRITIAFAAGYGLTALLLMIVYRPGV